MAVQKKNAYWLILLALLFLCLSVMGVGETTAHYENTAQWDTIMQPAQIISSDCLATGGQVILLGRLSADGILIEIRVQSDEELEGQLCLVSYTEELLSAGTVDTEIVLNEGATVIEMFLSPTDLALSLTEPAEVEVWLCLEAGGQVLEGTFRGTVGGTDKVTEESAEGESTGDAETEGTEKNDENDENNGDESNDSETAEDNAGSEDGGGEPGSAGDEAAEGEEGRGENAENTEDDGENNDDIAIGGNTGNESEDGDTESGNEETVIPSSLNSLTIDSMESVAEPLAEPKAGDANTSADGGEPGADESDENLSESAQEIPESTEEQTVGDSHETEESEETEEDLGESESGETESTAENVIETFELSTLESFSLKGTLPVIAELPEGSTKFTLKASGGFPAFTRYKLDGDETWYVLYFGGMIEVELSDTTTVYLQLDMSNSGMENWEELTLVAATYGETGLNGSAKTKTVAQAVLFSTKSLSTPIVLGESESLAFTLSESWAGCGVEYRIEYLSVVDEESMEVGYEEFDRSGLFDVTFDDDSVTVSVKERLPLAGTYRMTIRYNYGDVCFAESQITFFVNYANGAQPES